MTHVIGHTCSDCGRQGKGMQTHPGLGTLCRECVATKRDTIAARTTMSLLPPGVLSVMSLQAAIEQLEQELFLLDHSEMSRRSEVIYTQGRLIAAYRALVLELKTQSGGLKH